MQSAGGINNNYIRTSGLTGGNGVKYHGGRVRPLGVLDQLHICPLGPHFQLLNGSGTEGVCRAQDHLTALIFQPQS